MRTNEVIKRTMTGPKLLIGVGLTLVILGVLWFCLEKVLPIGRLPGDIAIEKENFKFYFPLGTSVLLSIAVSLILYLINYFKTR